jgi:hypothetical protein
MAVLKVFDSFEAAVSSEIRNSKPEIRNKFEMQKLQNSKLSSRTNSELFLNSNFGFASGFEFRVSNLLYD